MMMSLNRRIHRAYQRTRDANFSLEGLTGFTMYGKTAGVIGTGKIGVAMLRILKGFGMRLLAFDPYPSAAALELGVEYVDLATLYKESDVISLHCPLTDENYHLLNREAFRSDERRGDGDQHQPRRADRLSGGHRRPEAPENWRAGAGRL
jgi:D-lactate dehydrogenase